MTNHPESNALLKAYELATHRRRFQVSGGLAMVLVLAMLAAWMAEVNLVKFYDNIGNFTSYIDRISIWTPGKR